MRKIFYENEAQIAKILRKFEENYNAQFPKLIVFIAQKSAVHNYDIYNVKDGIQFRV